MKHSTFETKPKSAFQFIFFIIVEETLKTTPGISVERPENDHQRWTIEIVAIVAVNEKR